MRERESITKRKTKQKRIPQTLPFSLSVFTRIIIYFYTLSIYCFLIQITIGNCGNTIIRLKQNEANRWSGISSSDSVGKIAKNKSNGKWQWFIKTINKNFATIIRRDAKSTDKKTQNWMKEEATKSTQEKRIYLWFEHVLISFSSFKIC